jgi:hypothetical protein
MRPFFLTIASASGLLALALPSAAAADPAAPPPTAATTVAPVTAEANPDDKVVCKYQTPLGSRLGGKRVCMTQADWKAQELESRRQRDFAPPAGIAGAH